MATTDYKIDFADIAQYPAPGFGAPNSFRYNASGTRLTYLSLLEGYNGQQLLALDTNTGTVRIQLGAPDSQTAGELSPEEELRRQRERSLATGIARYMLQGDSVLVPLGEQLFTQGAPEADLRLLVDGSGQAAMQNPTFSPDGQWVAYVQDAEIYCIPTQGGDAQQVTQGARGTGKTNGLAEFIAQEELGRMAGFWWSRDSAAIAYTEVDETHIPVYRIMHQGKDDPTAQEDHHYPFAGAENARVRLAVVARTGGDPVWMDTDMGEECYIARVFWWHDGTLGALLLNRPQNTAWVVRWDVQTGARTLLHTEHNDAWVNLRWGGLKPLKDGTFLYTSERSGFCHIYHYAADGALLAQLTDGAWQVDQISAVDEKSGIVYFEGNKEAMRDRQLYAVPLAGGDLRRITPEAGTHTVVIDPQFNHFVDVQQSVNNAPRVTLRALANAEALRVIHEPTDERISTFDLQPPQFVTLTNRSGITLHGAIYQPPASYGEGPFPTIVYVYGGPGPQLVANQWRLTAALRPQALRERGFLVWMLDNRGSARRGLGFEAALKHRMGTVEVDDQVDGVRWLIERSLADPQRIGIYGWSYGGYMTLMCLLKAPELFKVGVSGAPVTAWDGYDTAYTERYMGTPQQNPDGYAAGNVMNHIENLQGRLLLVHGMLDENVHFRHTARLTNALNRARKPYDLLPLPDERHMPRRPADRAYIEARVINYFVDHL